MNDNNKKVAAISAVISYLRKEEEAFAFQQLHMTNSKSISIEPRVLSNAWGVSGRQEQMQTRSLMQMKALNRFN